MKSNSFSWGGCCNGGSNEGRPLLQPLPIEHVFSSCHKGFWVSSPKFNNFFHQCANMSWIRKGTRGPPLLILRSFLDKERR